MLHSGKEPSKTSIMCISLVMDVLLCNTQGLMSAALAGSLQLLSAVNKDFLSNETTVSTGAPRVNNITYIITAMFNKLYFMSDKCQKRLNILTWWCWRIRRLKIWRSRTSFNILFSFLNGKELLKS